jgi:hypothetical protein
VSTSGAAWLNISIKAKRLSRRQILATSLRWPTCSCMRRDMFHSTDKLCRVLIRRTESTIAGLLRFQAQSHQLAMFSNGTLDRGNTCSR